MRIFTAIIFEENLKTSLNSVTDRLREVTERGSFTIKDNLHLTLNFIGETDRLELVKKAMKQAVKKANTESFPITIKGFGRFMRREGDICYVGVEKDRSLWALQKELVHEFKEEGFPVDDLEYKPHLTLSRRTTFAGKFDDRRFGETIEPMRMEVNKISLMSSERIQGKLVYTEIYYIELD